jgi:O-antigen/teichoic acid export membrane protein
MEMSRTKNTIRNISYAVIGQVLGIVISLIARTVFIEYLGSELLGVNGLFTNILVVLTLVELGIGPAISYSLFKPIYNNDVEKIKSLMNLYKKAYKTIGIIILLLGVVMIPIYRFFFSAVPDISNLDAIFYLFVLNTGVSYFYSYKRSLIICDQKKYITTAYRYSFYTLLNVIQILIIIFTKNYLLYLVIQVTFTWLENYFISKKANQLYPYLKDKSVNSLSSKDLDSTKKNIKAMLMHKIGGIVVLSTDNILISKLDGLRSVALYSNYYLIIQAFQSIISQLFNSITASIGHLNAEKNVKSINNVFDRLFFLNFVIYGVISVCLLYMFDSFISLWVGNEFILSQRVLYVIVANFFLTGMRKTLLTFKDATGVFWNDRYRSILELSLNLGISILLGIKYGIFGVLLGTVISTILTFWIEPLVVFKYVLDRRVLEYFRKLLFYSLILIVQIYVVSLYTPNIFNNSFILFASQSIYVLLVSSVILIITTFWTNEFKYFVGLFIDYIKNFKKNRRKK